MDNVPREPVELTASDLSAVAGGRSCNHFALAPFANAAAISSNSSFSNNSFNSNGSGNNNGSGNGNISIS
jgi:hypothetical protein